MGGACPQPNTSELNPQDPHNGKIEPTPTSVSSELFVTHTCAHTICDK